MAKNIKVEYKDGIANHYITQSTEDLHLPSLGFTTEEDAELASPPPLAKILIPKIISAPITTIATAPVTNGMMFWRIKKNNGITIFAKTNARAV